jgi:hypothetical protein
MTLSVSLGPPVYRLRCDACHIRETTASAEVEVLAQAHNMGWLRWYGNDRLHDFCSACTRARFNTEDSHAAAA